MSNKSIIIEGFTTEQLLNLPDEQIESFVFANVPIIFKMGSSEILGKFQLRNENLTVELAQIDGGGEGVLPLLFVIAKKYAQQRKITRIEWIVHALNCAKPNPKLRPIMEKRGFKIEEIEGIGKAYYFSQNIEY